MKYRPPHPVLVELRAERKRRDLTQADIAAAMGTTAPAVSHLETGYKSPVLATLIRYADALGYDLTIAKKGR